MDWRHSRPARIGLLLIIALIALAGIVPYFLSSNFVRDQLVLAVQRDTQRQLEIRGSTHFVLLPRPAVLIKDATLTEPNDKTVFAHADEIKMAFRLWPLLSEAKAVAHSLDIAGPELTIIRFENGTYNFEDLLQNKGSTIELGLDSLSFSDAKLAWQDDFLGETFHLAQLNVELENLTDPKKGQLTLDGQVLVGNKGEAPRWRGQIHGTAAMRYLEPQKKLHFADIKMAIDQDGASHPALQLSNAALQISGYLNYAWDPLILAGGDLKILLDFIS